jgi:hypothetical protein
MGQKKILVVFRGLSDWNLETCAEQKKKGIA